jgi:integrase
VAVWTARQLAAFFDFLREDRLYAMWWLIALRGLRRGEAAGLRWIDLDLHQHVVMIEQQRIADGHTVAVGPPKTKASRRTIALDRTTVRLLRAHLRQQQTEHEVAGRAWHESEYLFTTDDGKPLHPDWLTRRFGRLVTDSGLPPVRLHDLRHGAATLAHEAGADLKTVQEQLGHRLRPGVRGRSSAYPAVVVVTRARQRAPSGAAHGAPALAAARGRL